MRSPAAACDSDAADVIEALRAGDEAAFVDLVSGLHGVLILAAAVYVSDPAAAEEVVRETWVRVLDRLDVLDARASLRACVCGIAVDIARTRAVRERRRVPFSWLAGIDERR